MKTLVMRALFCAAAAVALVALGSPGSGADKDKKGKAIEVKAADLAMEFKKDEKKAEEKYKDKLMRVSGEVDSVMQEVVDLKTGDNLPKIIFRFKDAASTKQLKDGQKVVIEGRFELVSVRGPSFGDCKVVK